MRIFPFGVFVLASCVVSNAASAQIGPGPWSFSNIDTGVFVSEASQVLESYEDGTGQSYEIQHAAYSFDFSGFGRTGYATRSRSNGGAWPSAWTLHTQGLPCSEPSIAVRNNGAVFLSCVRDDDVSVYWRDSNGFFTQALVDPDATDARNGNIVLRTNSSGSLSGIHITYQKRGPTGSRVVAHRWCTTFPSCHFPADWKEDEVPISSPNPARVPLIASGNSIEVAVPKGSDVWFVNWYPVGGWDTSSVRKPVVGSLSGYVDEVAFKRNINGRIAAATAGTSAFVIEWDGYYPYRYEKVSGSDIVDTDHIDVVFGAGAKPAVVYQMEGVEDLALARRSPIGFWGRQVIASTGEVGRWPRIEQGLDGKYVIVYFDRSLMRLRSVVGQ